jgi:hypothetical protein
MAKAQQGELTLLSVAEPWLFTGADEQARYGGAVAEQHNAALAQLALVRVMDAAREAGILCESVVAHRFAMRRHRRHDAAQALLCHFYGHTGTIGTLDPLRDESTTQNVIQNYGTGTCLSLATARGWVAGQCRRLPSVASRQRFSKAARMDLVVRGLEEHALIWAESCQAAGTTGCRLGTVRLLTRLRAT